MMWDVQITQVFEGSSQIQEMIIADHLLGGGQVRKMGEERGRGILGGYRS